MWGIASVLWEDSISTVGDTFSALGVVQYSGDHISTVRGYLQYCGGYSVHWGDNISTCGGITSVQWGITSVLWRVFSRVGEEF